jgi:hypothetical protein
MSEDQINPAGVFLRTLREGGRAGGQTAEGGQSLPVRQVLFALVPAARTRSELAAEMSLSRGILDETLRNLASLELIRASGLGEEEKISLTDLGRDVVRRG